MARPVAREGVIAIRETPKALLVQLKDGEEVWVPQSVIHDDSQVFCKGDCGTLLVLRWWAEANEWDDEDDDYN